MIISHVLCDYFYHSYIIILYFITICMIIQQILQDYLFDDYSTIII